MSSVKEQSIWIGVDVGTTGGLAIVYEASSVSRAAAWAFYPLRTPHPDRAEERPSEIRAATEMRPLTAALSVTHSFLPPYSGPMAITMRTLA